MTDIDFFSYLDYHRQVIIYQKKKNYIYGRKFQLKEGWERKYFGMQ